MQSFSHFSLILSFFTLLISAHPLETRQAHPGHSLVCTIYQFPNESWVENIAVRANGKILVTLVDVPEVWQIDPLASPATAEVVYHFPDATSCFGIAEYAPDVFAVNVGTFDYHTVVAKAGSFSVWSVDMGSEQSHSGWHHRTKHGPKAHKIADIAPAEFLNGMTALPANPSTVLLGDTSAGLIYSLNTASGDYTVLIDDPALKPNQSAPVPIGVNGIHFAPGADDFVYFTNTLKRPMFSRIPVDPTTGTQTGSDEVVVESFAELGGGPDDFAISGDGKAAYIADGALNGLLKVDLSSGKEAVLVGGTDSSPVIGQTSCAFGRSKEDIEKGTLYITNNGGIFSPPPQGIVGGGVYALDTEL